MSYKDIGKGWRIIFFYYLITSLSWSNEKVFNTDSNQQKNFQIFLQQLEDAKFSNTYNNIIFKGTLQENNSHPGTIRVLSEVYTYFFSLSNLQTDLVCIPVTRYFMPVVSL